MINAIFLACIFYNVLMGGLCKLIIQSELYPRLSNPITYESLIDAAKDRLEVHVRWMVAFSIAYAIYIVIEYAVTETLF